MTDLPVDLPPWMPIARAEIGQREVRGGENARIVEYLKGTTLPPAMARVDETPWCAAYVDWVLKRARFAGTSSAAAASFLSWGRALGAFRPGCIVVIRRRDLRPDAGTGSPSGNHVGFGIRETRGVIRLLGGNQADGVNEADFSRERWEIRGYRWPAVRVDVPSHAPARKA